MQRKKYTHVKRQFIRRAVDVYLFMMIIGCGRQPSSDSKETQNPPPAAATQITETQISPKVIDTKPVGVAATPDTEVIPSEAENTPGAQIKAARRLAKKEQWGDAVSVLKKARKRFPDNTTVLGELGWAAFNDGNRSLARETTLRAVALESRPKIKAAFLYNLGRIEELSRDVSAIAHYRQSLQLRPNDTVKKRLAELISKLQPTGGSGWALYDSKSKRFSYRGQMVSPACVSRVMNCGGPASFDYAPVALSSCQERIGQIKFEKDKIILKGEADAPNAYDEYEVFAYNGDQFLIHSVCNGGGASHFEDLSIASLKNGQLTKVAGIGGGDRCYHGYITVEPSPDENIIRYTYSVCAKDILDFDSIGKTLPVADCDDVDCSALCCIADAQMAYDFNTHEITFLGIEIDGSTLPKNDGEEGIHRYQPCFNSLLRGVTSAAGGHTLITPEKLSEFVTLFSKRCLK